MFHHTLSRDAPRNDTIGGLYSHIYWLCFYCICYLEKQTKKKQNTNRHQTYQNKKKIIVGHVPRDTLELVMNECITEIKQTTIDSRFWMGVPRNAVILFRCLYHWKVFENSNLSDEILPQISKEIENSIFTQLQWNLSEQSFWMCSTGVLSHLVRHFCLNQQSVPSPRHHKRRRRKIFQTQKVGCTCVCVCVIFWRVAIKLVCKTDFLKLHCHIKAGCKCDHPTPSRFFVVCSCC